MAFHKSSWRAGHHFSSHSLCDSNEGVGLPILVHLKVKVGQREEKKIPNRRKPQVQQGRWYIMDLLWREGVEAIHEEVKRLLMCIAPSRLRIGQ